ncbi:MAG: hypothetical protein P8M25_13170 [Paracoccaceae bacterium]|nr:hypothetical protein [Paracoccaceae bacterium]
MDGGNDRIYGRAFNDYIDGRKDVDSMVSGAGNDDYSVDVIGESAVEYNGQGTNFLLC